MFQATHTIVSKTTETLVMECDGVLYTQSEWEAGSRADWEISNGALTFQGSLSHPECDGVSLKKGASK